MAAIVGWTTFTGTADQPDSVSLFYKKANGTIEIQDEEILNSMGHSPMEMMTAIPRIQEAVERLWKEPTLNAFQNLGRGFAQLVPLLGNASLYAFDYLRTNFYFHPNVRAALETQNPPVMGFAFDGKIVATFTPDELSRKLNDTPDNALQVFQKIWFMQLSNAHKTFSLDRFPTRLQLAERLVSKIKAGSLS